MVECVYVLVLDSMKQFIIPIIGHYNSLNLIMKHFKNISFFWNHRSTTRSGSCPYFYVPFQNLTPRLVNNQCQIWGTFTRTKSLFKLVLPTILTTQTHHHPVLRSVQGTQAKNHFTTVLFSLSYWLSTLSLYYTFTCM